MRTSVLPYRTAAPETLVVEPVGRRHGTDQSGGSVRAALGASPPVEPSAPLHRTGFLAHPVNLVVGAHFEEGRLASLGAPTTQSSPPRPITQSLSTAIKILRRVRDHDHGVLSSSRERPEELHHARLEP